MSDECRLCGREPPADDQHSFAGDTLCVDCYVGVATDGSAETSAADRDGDLTVRAHYERIADAVASLATLDDAPTMLVNDRRGWYVTRENTTPDDADIGRFEKERRPRSFSDDYATTARSVDRTLYTLTSYKSASAFERWEPATFDEGREEYKYRGEKPMPIWADTAAVAAWGDVDLADDLKPDRPDLNDDTYAVAEAAFAAYVDAFADLYGGREAVFMLDSVGGAYLFGAPAATLPITEHFADDDDARARVFEAFVARTNDYFRNAEEYVNETVEGAAEVVHPDWANNRNRLYKMPLALHGDHDAVVTPVDIDGGGDGGVTYRAPTPVDAVDDDLLARVRDWCDAYTNTEFTDRVDGLVAALWPEESVATDGDWRETLDRWVTAERATERANHRARARARERREECRQARRDARTVSRSETDTDGTTNDAGLTPFRQDVYDAFDSIDTADVIRQYACDEWDTGTDAAGKTEFNPSWRASKSGSSCFIDHEANTFGDPSDGGGGYAAKAMALGEGIITNASDDLAGEDWRRAVDALRDIGYDIPLWTPETGSTRGDSGKYEKMPFWAVREAAVALGVLDHDDFVEKTADDGETYFGFSGGETYNATLDAVADAGLDHGREFVDTTTAAVSDNGRKPDERDGEGSSEWEYVRTLFQSTDNGSTTRAYNVAADAVLADESFVCVRETDEFYRYDPELGYYRRKGKSYIRERLREAIPECVNNNRMKNVIERVRDRCYLDQDEFTPPDGKIVVETGVLNLNSREVEPFTPDYYFTAGLACEYDPEATAAEWNETLRAVVPNDGARATLQEFVGYCLEVWHHKWAKNLFAVGPTASGKSTFVDTVAALFGEDLPSVTNLTPQQLADTQFDRSALAEAALNARNDINATKIEDSGTLKTIFAGERVKMERKYQDPTFSAPAAKHLFSANWLPRVVGEDESIYRRVLIVEFPDTISRKERDLGLKERLQENELSGILNWALNGRDRLHEQGGFTRDRSLMDTRLTWLSWRSAPLRFLFERCEITGDSDDTVERKSAYQAYKEWAARNGYDIRPQQSMTNYWKQVPHVEVTREKKMNVFSGVRFSEQGTDTGADLRRPGGREHRHY